MVSTEVVIIGGGLAGLTAGIHLFQNGISVTNIEKNEYPKHKVCGEYVSNEIKGYLESLAIPIQSIVLDIEEKYEIVIDNPSMERMINVKAALEIIDAKLNE